MSTSYRSGNRRFKSKSDWARTLFAEGKTIVEVCEIIPKMGYAFAHGIADRAGFLDTAAKRRPEKRVKVLDDGTIEIRLDAGGHVSVNPATGKVTRRKT